MSLPRARVRTSLATLAVTLSAVGLAVAVPASAAPAAAATATVTGVVTGDGRPLQGVTVLAGIAAVSGFNPIFIPDVSTKTAADGSYRLTGVPTNSGERIQFVAAGAVGGTSSTGYADLCAGGEGNCATGGRDFTFAGGRTTTVDAALSRAGVVRGRLTDSAGRGIGKVPVYLYENGTDQAGDGDVAVRSVTSDADGNWTIPRLWAHSWAVCFSKPQRGLVGTPNRDGYVAACRTGRVTVTSGGTATANSRLRGGGGVSGRVVDTGGDPVAGATVSIEQTDPTVPALSTTTDANGRFRLGKLPPGRHDVTVDAATFFISRTSISVTQFTTTAAGRIVLIPAD